MKHKKFFSFIIPFICMITFSYGQSVTQSSSLREFDKQVLDVRQHMRSSCALLQKLMKNSDEQTIRQAIKEIQQASTLWEKLQERYKTQPPVEYQQDDKFTSCLEAIKMGMRDMEKGLEERKFDEAMKFCGKTCGLFVTMHEENRFVYAADRLFHLRKLAKK